MDFLKSDIAVQLFGQDINGFSGYHRLDLRKLYGQRSCKQESDDSDQCQPEYFERLFYNSFLFEIQLAKIVKISDKIRIFAP